jgi:rhamnogalacturonyl hydrolase YesR
VCRRAYALIGNMVVLACVSACGIVEPGRDASREEPEPYHVSMLLRRAAEYQVAQLAPIDEQGASWQLCTFYVGALAAYEATGTVYYRDMALQWARANDWQIRSSRSRNADFQCIGQAFLELYLQDRAAHRLRGTQETFDAIVGDPRPGNEAWSWADALFMAPPVLARLTSATDDEAYIDFMSRQYWEASAPLFDSEQGLYYRDTRYISQQTASGKDVFWSRGNGWVLAGLARILQFLPSSHPAHSRFINRFQTMAAAVAPLQGRDGLWRASLLDPSEYPAPESSGTALFCYALAWGINAGYLDERRYRPVVFRAWTGLEEAVDDEGRLGWVQDVGSRPEPVSARDTGVYGVGGLLLAGSELFRMVSR